MVCTSHSNHIPVANTSIMFKMCMGFGIAFAYVRDEKQTLRLTHFLTHLFSDISVYTPANQTYTIFYVLSTGLLDTHGHYTSSLKVIFEIYIRKMAYVN